MHILLLFGFDRKPRKSLCPSVCVSVCNFVEFFTLSEREILRLVYKQLEKLWFELSQSGGGAESDLPNVTLLKVHFRPF